MKPPPFAYARASSVAAALELLEDGGEDAKVLAGGQSLMPLLAYRLARPTHLVDIGRVPGLDRIDVTAATLSVGALVTHARLERCSELVGPWRALRECAGQIGHYPIRTQGTFGGSLAHADPAAELSVASLALDAQLVARSRTGERLIPAGEFFVGPFTTALAPDELLVGARFSAPGVQRRSAFEEFATRAGDFASASTAVVLTRDDGRAHDVRIALGSVGPTPVRAFDAEAVLEDTALDERTLSEAARLSRAACTTSGDAHADLEFRRELVAELVGRALRRIAEES